MNRIAAISVLATVLAAPAAAASEHACARYTLHDVSPGMTHKLVRKRMRWDGVRTVIRTPQGTETSAIDFPEKSSDVYVEFDRRVDRRGEARAVLVRASIPWKEGTAALLLTRFGPPRDGAETLASGLEAGAALWVDERCGVVVTAYRPRGSWWAAEGGTALQVESLDRVRKGRSPVSAQLQALLAKKPAPAPAPAPLPAPPETILAQALPPPPPPIAQPIAQPEDVRADEPAESPPPEPPPPVIADVPPLVASSPPTNRADEEANNDAEAEADVDPPVDPPVEQPPAQQPPAPAQTNPPAVVTSIKAWGPPRSPQDTPPVDTRPTPPSAPQTIKSWRGENAASAAVASPREPLTIRTWRPREIPPARISVVPPVYPAAARRLSVKGHVTLAIVVLPDGTVAERPRVLAAHPAGRGFEESAVDAVRRWRYNPAVREGKPVASDLTVGIDFK